MFIVYMQLKHTIVLAKTTNQGMISIFYVNGFNIKKIILFLNLFSLL